jgi:glycosyltransferase involved in cell wall biosynthesis
LRVLVYSYFPPLRYHLAGGAQRFLDGLLAAFEQTSVAVTVLCPPLPGRELLPERPGLRIVDELAVVDADPVPAQAHADLLLLEQCAGWADVVLTIDRRFPLRCDVPVVLCLNNFSYGPETRSVFSLDWDAVVVPSEYLRRCVEWYFGEATWTGAPRPVQVIPCGVGARNVTVDAGSLRADLRLSPCERYLAFPHRPDPDKGFETAVQAVVRLRQQGEPLTLLVPSPRSTEVWPHQRIYLEERQRFVKDLGAESAVRFHRWIQADEMTAYLSATEWSLCLSRLPEGFGVSVIEGLLGGVGVVATPAGAVPELVPDDHGVRLVEFDDADAVADVIGGGLPRDAVAKGRDYVRTTYDWSKIATRWAEWLPSVQKSYAIYRPRPLYDESAAPWLRRLRSGRRWHDYRMDYLS